MREGMESARHLTELVADHHRYTKDAARIDEALRDKP